jgi:hypothetical protein
LGHNSLRSLLSIGTPAGFSSELSGLVPAGHLDERAACCYAARFAKAFGRVSNPVSTAQLRAEAERRNAQLGIPTVLDRFIPQAVMQLLQRRWDLEFSDHSYGFRLGRSAHRAVAQAQQYITEGRGWCVGLDLKKFFDRVNHERRMAPDLQTRR